ncbi:EAL domain-containing protein [Actinoplanes sp. URMC 104]|uniref:EAL domain-containing protein n=1 Tax=Actinoplanes sp. URMC 104 TaxID=3423409 RepID=UPI003F1DF7A9
MVHTAHPAMPAPPATAIDAVLTGRLVNPTYQPIVDLSTGATVGLEALARGPAGTDLEFPDRLFAAAHEAARLGELDMLCCERAIENAIATPIPPPLLFINAEPGVLNQPLSPRLLELLHEGLPFRVALEFTERALPAVPGSLLRLAAQVQQWGNSLALDDVGVDPMSLIFLPIIEPEVIKLDMSLVRNPHAAHTRLVCAAVGAEARRTEAVVIAEGIETPEDLRAARELGAHWGQGWLFGRPGRLSSLEQVYQPGAAELLRRPRPNFHQPVGTPFETAASRASVIAGTADEMAAALTRLRDIAADDDTSVVIISDSGGVPSRTAALQELARNSRPVILLDHAVPDECTVAVLRAGCGWAVSARDSRTGLDLVTLDHLPDVATVARVMLSRHI